MKKGDSLLLKEMILLKNNVELLKKAFKHYYTLVLCFQQRFNKGSTKVQQNSK